MISRKAEASKAVVISSSSSPRSAAGKLLGRGLKRSATARSAKKI